MIQRLARVIQAEFIHKYPQFRGVKIGVSLVNGETGGSIRPGMDRETLKKEAGRE